MNLKVGSIVKLNDGDILLITGYSSIDKVFFSSYRTLKWNLEGKWTYYSSYSSGWDIAYPGSIDEGLNIAEVLS